MCGIAGALYGKTRVDGRALGERMAATLRHRGPDGHGVRELPREKGVFAHTRLAIIDLTERASQPFVSEDGEVTLVFNGEIYEFAKLRAQLERDGARFRSDSDTEVVLETYRRRGAAGLDALDGMFAFAMWDARAGTLLLMRDRLGKKPLYWAEAADGMFLFGSEPKALRAYEHLAVSADEKLIPELLTYGYTSTPRSMYRGMHKLQPGTRMIVDGETREKRFETYWSIWKNTFEPLEVTVPAAKELVRTAVGEAVERRLVADVPLGAFLSGGIDSSVVVAEMARRSSHRVRTFSVGFDDDATFDETQHAREVAQRFDTDHTELRLGPVKPEVMEQLLRFHDEPYGDSSALALHAIAAATRKHVTVVLTGDGGDEVFAGYTRFLGGLLAGALPPGVGEALKRASGYLPHPRGYKHPIALLRRFLEHADKPRLQQLLAWNSFFAGDALEKLLRPEIYGHDFDPWSVLADQVKILEESSHHRGDRLAQILDHNLLTYLLDDLLVKADRMTMAVGLEARSPFLDIRLVELCFRLPSSIKMRYGQLKWLLREAYRDVLPTTVLDRKKHGFGVPVARWWNGALAPLVDDLLLAPNARVAQYLVPSEIAKLIKEHRTNTRDHGQRLFLLLQLEMWLRTL